MQELDSWLDSQIFTHRFYHEAPDDVFVMLLSDMGEYGWGNGGFNNLRLVSKRCLRVVESVATRLTYKEQDGQNSLPISTLQQCKRIEHIRCDSENLSSLEGCPDGLESLVIKGKCIRSLAQLSACAKLKSLEMDQTNWVSDISPLSSCANLQKIIFWDSVVIDLTPLSSLTLLEELNIPSAVAPTARGSKTIENLAPLFSVQEAQETEHRRLQRNQGSFSPLRVPRS